MNLDSLVLNVLIGLGVGTIYALMGVGLSIIYGVMKIFNFAQGELYMLGAYTLYVFTAWANLPMIPSLILSMLTVFFFSVFAERVLVHNIHGGKIENPFRYAVIVTLGLSMVLIHGCLLIFGAYPLSPPADYVSGYYSIGSFGASGNRLFAFGATLAIFAFLFVFLKKTWTGRAMRAVAQSRVGASVVGINIPDYYLLAFGLSGMFAAAAGALLAPIYFMAPDMGLVPMSKGWIILVFGGMGSTTGAFIGGLILGVVEVLGALAISPLYVSAYGLAALIAILVWRPHGLLGEKVRRA